MAARSGLSRLIESFAPCRKEFLKFGKIIKMVINANSAYVTYTRAEDAVAAIKSLNDKGSKSGGGGGPLSSLRASLGTTKYCSHWLRCQTCPKQPDCECFPLLGFLAR